MGAQEQKAGIMNFGVQAAANGIKEPRPAGGVNVSAIKGRRGNQVGAVRVEIRAENLPQVVSFFAN